MSNPKTSHTPGPWKIDHEAPPVPVSFVTLHCFVIASERQARNECEAIAVVGAANGPRNADLIVAAPELLEACQAIQVADESGSSAHMSHAKAMMRSAIAKATNQKETC